MSRGPTTVALLVVASVLALGATLADSASAKWFVGGKELTAGQSAAISLTTTVNQAPLLNLPALKIKLKCTGLGIEKGTVVGGGEIIEAGSLTYSGCEVSEPKVGTCTLEGTVIESKPITATATLATAVAARVLVKPKSGAELAVVPFSEANTCALAGEQPLKGKVTLNAPSLESELAEQPIEGLGSFENNSLELGSGNKAFIEGGRTLLKLTSGSKWKFVEGEKPVGPPPPKIEQVDFKNNQAVLIDHRSNTKGEPALTINSFGEKNAVEWQQSTTAGFTKNWPVVFVKKTKPKLIARFAVEKPTEEFISKDLEGNATVTGTGTLAGVAVKLETEVTKAELEAHKGAGFITTPEFETKNTELADKVLYESATITWKWKLKEKGKAAFEQDLGQSTHNFYLIKEALLAGVTNYLTLLDLDTQGIEKEATTQPPSDAEAIKGIWSEFKTRKVGLRWYDIESGALHRGGIVMNYYEEHKTVGLTLKEVWEKDNSRCSLTAVASLLSEAEGQCGAWAQMFSYTLGIEGLSSVGLQAEPLFTAGKCSTETCRILVNNWVFGAGKGGEFPYSATEVKDAAGIVGQGSPTNPPSIFERHYLVETKKGEKKIYDPSYGTGPYEGAEPLKEFQEKSVAGFCGSFDSSNETLCQKSTASILHIIAPLQWDFK